MSRKSSRHAGKSGRDPGGFVAIPWSVLDSAAYRALSMHARVLLVEIARQLRGDNNGSLLCSRAYMAPRGWTSSDMLTKAKRELLAAGFLHETVIGQRPNKASWYAVTWQTLDKLNGFDQGAAETFKRSAYQSAAMAAPKPTRDELYRKWNPIPAKVITVITPEAG
jgi:hypothetical protein